MKLSEIESHILKQLSISLGWEDIADPKNEYHLDHITIDEYLQSCRRLKLLSYIELEEHNQFINGINAKITSQGLTLILETNIPMQNPSIVPPETPSKKISLADKLTSKEWAIIGIIVGIILTIINWIFF